MELGTIMLSELRQIHKSHVFYVEIREEKSKERCGGAYLMKIEGISVKEREQKKGGGEKRGNIGE